MFAMAAAIILTTSQNIPQNLADLTWTSQHAALRRLRDVPLTITAVVGGARVVTGPVPLQRLTNTALRTRWPATPVWPHSIALIWMTTWNVKY